MISYCINNLHSIVTFDKSFWKHFLIIFTAPIRRMTGGYIFTLCVSPDLDWGGGYPIRLMEGYPLPRSRWGVPPSQVWMWGGIPSQGARWQIPPARSPNLPCSCQLHLYSWEPHRDPTLGVANSCGRQSEPISVKYARYLSLCTAVKQCARAETCDSSIVLPSSNQA